MCVTAVCVVGVVASCSSTADTLSGKDTVRTGNALAASAFATQLGQMVMLQMRQSGQFGTQAAAAAAGQVLPQMQVPSSVQVSQTTTGVQVQVGGSDDPGAVWCVPFNNPQLTPVNSTCP